MIFMCYFQVMILITGAHKAFALYKAIEEGVNHMWTVSAFQQHAHTLMICDEDATLELRVKTVKYFKVSASATRPLYIQSGSTFSVFLVEFSTSVIYPCTTFYYIGSINEI